MDTQTVLSILIFANTTALLFIVLMVVFGLIKMSVEIAKFAEIQTSLAELAKVIEQQTRLLEFISRRPQ